MDERDTTDTIQTHLSNRETWMRLLYMVLYGIVFEIGKFVCLLVAVLQFLFKLFRGRPMPELQDFGFSLAEFYRQTIEFLTFRTEQKPYPWSDWPKAKAVAEVEPATSEPAPEPAKPARKTPVRKRSTTSRKKAAPKTSVKKKPTE